MGRNRIAGGQIRWLACMICLAGALAVLVPAAAYAGDWMQVSCVNPDGSAAPSDGWTGFEEGSPGTGSNFNTQCGPGRAMYAGLGSGSAAGGSEVVLQYTPPSGSMLVGGSLDVNVYAGGYGSGATGTAPFYMPAFTYDGSDVFFECFPGSDDCTDAMYSGTVTVAANRGGNLYIGAFCRGPSSDACSEGVSNGFLVDSQVLSAQTLLFSNSSPAASGFGGSLLSPNPTGTADVSFTATDAGGPGVYNVTATVDGVPVYDATPQTESGHCVAVGTDTASGALMFDWQQPCPTTAFVDIPVNTATLSDGPHELTITVTDAAQDRATVLDQTFSTERTGGGSVSTPAPPSRPHHIKAKLRITWQYTGSHTRLLGVKAFGLLRDAQVSISCSGHDCPQSAVRSERADHVSRLWKALARLTFTAGDREIVTITAPQHLRERIQILIRADEGPVAKVL